MVDYNKILRFLHNMKKMRSGDSIDRQLSSDLIFALTDEEKDLLLIISDIIREIGHREFQSMVSGISGDRIFKELL